MAALWQDLRYGLRMLAKSPGFTAVAVLTLALGIGANTATFSLIDQTVLKWLPVKNPEQLVQLFPRGGFDDDFPITTFEQLRDRSHSFSGMFASDGSGLSAVIDGQPEIVQGRFVSGSYHTVMGVVALLGRPLAPEDDQPGKPPVAVISYTYWQRRFGLSPSVLGKTITLKAIPFTIVGVTPDLGRGWRPDVLVPMAVHASLRLKDHVNISIAGRLKAGVSEEQASAELTVLYQQILTQSAGSALSPKQQRDLTTQGIELRPAGRGGYHEFSLQLRTMMGVVGFVLLIACANVANLLLARGTARRKEIAVRLAIGAGRGRLVRQLLTESILLAIIAGAFGLLLALWGDHLLWALVARHPSPISPDLRILAFTAAATMLTGVIFGLVPAFRATQVDLTPALKQNDRGLMGSSQLSSSLRLGPGKALVIAQVALSLILLMGAGLFIRSLQKLNKVEVGFNRENVLLVWTLPTLIGYEGPREISLYWQLLERMRAIPGVQSASLSRIQLFSGYWAREVSVQGYTPGSNEDMKVSANAVSPRFFETMGIPLLLGRDFSPADDATAPKVAIISETMARQYFPNENPIGRHFSFPKLGARGTREEGEEEIEIVGVARDIKTDFREQQHQRSPRGAYIPFPQAPPTMLGQAVFELRTAANPSDVAAAARHQARAVERNLPLGEIQTQAGIIDESLGRDRWLARLTVFFGLLALLLASIGLYGTISYSVSRRTNEIGIRMALGAQHEEVLRMVLREAMFLIWAGVGIGLASGLVLMRVITSQLYEVSASDPLTLAGASLFLVAVACLAGYIPARRATKVDPMVALRYE